MERVLVTGAAGFIGSHVVERLLADGHDVIGVDNFDPYYDPVLKERNLAAAAGNATRFELVRGDLTDPAVLDRAFARPPARVVHLAAKAGVRPSMRDPLAYERANVQALLALLERVRAAGTPRMVFASSSSVYGLRDKMPLSETDDTSAPASVYGATKRTGELMCAVYARAYGLVLPCLRFFTVYGPRQRPDMAISRFVHAVATGEPVLQYGDGTSTRDYTFVADAVAAVLAASTAPLLEGAPPINIGAGRRIILADLIAAVGTAVGKPPRVQAAPNQLGDPTDTQADIARARTLLAWEPKTPLESGLSQYVAWLRKQPGSPL